MYATSVLLGMSLHAVAVLVYFPLKACKMLSGITKVSPQGGSCQVRTVGKTFPKYVSHDGGETIKVKVKKKKAN